MDCKFWIVFTLLMKFVTCDIAKDVLKNAKDQKSKLPPCAACVSLVKSFESGIEITSRGKFEGGDTAWEEKNQGKGYAISEVRFVEIQEKLCRDVSRGETQCHDNHHEWEEHLEEWWALGHVKPDLRNWLCEEKLKVCCPDNHYGSKCQPCNKLGTNGLLCSGRGKCKGSGTRKGNGACQCNKGFSGETCDKCAAEYFEESEKNVENLKCTACHKSCLDQCSGPGPNQCLACKKGYLMNNGCHDLDECAEAAKSKSKICLTDEFCVNTEGSYNCHKCDKSCASCTGDGPDSCIKCAEGYTESNNVCVTNEAADLVNTTTASADENVTEDTSDLPTKSQDSTLDHPKDQSDPLRSEL